MQHQGRLAEILLAEDNEGDVELTREAFKQAKFRNNLHVVRDGDEALDYLRKRNGYEQAVTPDIILLDLNMPKVDGTEVLEEVKNDPKLRRIPIIVLTSSEAEQDVLASYDLHANAYVVKPVDGLKFIKVVQEIQNFWVDIVFLSKIDA